MKLIVLVMVILSGALGAVRADKEKSNEARLPPFGFRGMEVFRASHESVGLLAEDMDGDGLVDLVYADNADATLRLLFQRKPGDGAGSGDVKKETPAAAKGASSGKKSYNEIDYDSRFRVERFFTEKKVTSLIAADLDGDRKTDLAYYGDPKELEIVYQSAEWGARREKFAIADGSEGSAALAAVDIDGDGRNELLLLGPGKIYLLHARREAAGFEKPQVIYSSFPDAVGLEAADLDGDGRKDLFFLRPRASHPFLLRFQGPDGFGPEILVKSLPVLEAVLEVPPGAEKSSAGKSEAARILAVQGNTRRIRELQWSKPKEAPLLALGEPRYYAFRPEGDQALRRVHLGDVNGDGRVDLLVSSFETAELDVYLQNSRGELSPPSPSPTLAEVKAVVSADFDSDGKPEVVVASAREKSLGVSRWLPSGRLSIPETQGVEGEPLLLAASPAGPRHPAELFLVLKSAAGKFRLEVRSAADGGLAPRGGVAFEAGAEPNGLSVFDADGDGLPDALVFIGYDDPRLYLRQKDNAPGKDGEVAFREVSREKDFGIGQVQKLPPSAFSLTAGLLPESAGASPAAPILLVAQKSFARALRLGADGKLRVVEQFAGRGAAAEIAGACAVNLDADPEKEVALFDRSESSIEILDRNPQGVYRAARTIALAGASAGFEFQGFRVLDLDGDGKEDVVILGKQGIAVLYQGGAGGDLEEVSRYDLGDPELDRGETHGLPNLLAVGDFNADGLPDLVFCTEPLSILGFLARDPAPAGGPLRLRLSFPIFEEKSFMRRGPGHGPRELVARDVTGDGKCDLLVLIHDRIILYPQE